MFRSSHFSFSFFGHFWRQSYESTKTLRNPCLNFARWARQKKRKGNHATKVTKTPKTKRRKYGMNETFISLAVGDISELTILFLFFVAKHHIGILLNGAT